MWTALVVTVVLGALPPKDAPAGTAEDRHLKVLGRGAWPVRYKEPTHLVIRNAEELARSHRLDGEDAKNRRFQADVTADTAVLLKVKTIDWKTQMLVVVAAGTKPTGGYSVEILTLPVKDKTLTVHWKLNSPKGDSTVRQAPSYPGQMVLIERFTGTVKFDPPVDDK